jgi:hypothetical protein
MRTYPGLIVAIAIAIALFILPIIRLRLKSRVSQRLGIHQPKHMDQ